MVRKGLGVRLSGSPVVFEARGAAAEAGFPTNIRTKGDFFFHLAWLRIYAHKRG